jgi:hypothetical protein
MVHRGVEMQQARVDNIERNDRISYVVALWYII